MDFEKYTDVQNRRLLRPSKTRDRILFEHCAEGMNGVTFTYFSFVVMPLLRIHGIEQITIEGEDQ